MELIVARTSRIPRAQLIFIDHRVIKLWALRTLNTLVTAPGTTKTKKNRHTFHRNDILHHTVSLLVIDNTSHIFYIIES